MKNLSKEKFSVNAMDGGQHKNIVRQLLQLFAVFYCSFTVITVSYSLYCFQLLFLSPTTK